VLPLSWSQDVSDQPREGTVTSALHPSDADLALLLRLIVAIRSPIEEVVKEPRDVYRWWRRRLDLDHHHLDLDLLTICHDTLTGWTRASRFVADRTIGDVSGVVPPHVIAWSCHDGAPLREFVLAGE